jgi:hypothetical protein
VIAVIAPMIAAIFAAAMIISLSLGGHMNHFEQITWAALTLFWSTITAINEVRIRRLRDEIETLS